jgi:Tfp pilus assembly protein PilN
VLGVGVEGDLGNAAVPFNLLAPESRDSPAKSRAVVVARALAVVAAILALVALAYPLWQKREAVIDLQPRLDRAKASADVADRLAQEIEKLASEHNFLVSRKQGQYPAVVLLEDLSRLLPDATWVQQLDIKAGPKFRELQLAGETGSSSQLVEVLEKSGSLVNANFKSPLTKGVTPGTERFLIAAEVKARALPEPMPEASLTVSSAAATSAPATVPAPGSTPSAVPGAPPNASAVAPTAPAGASRPAEAKGAEAKGAEAKGAEAKGAEAKGAEAKGAEPAVAPKPAVKG